MKAKVHIVFEDKTEIQFDAERSRLCLEEQEGSQVCYIRLICNENTNYKCWKPTVKYGTKNA